MSVQRSVCASLGCGDRVIVLIAWLAFKGPDLPPPGMYIVKTDLMCNIGQSTGAFLGGGGGGGGP